MNIPIMKPSFSKKEADAVLEVLQTGWVAQGPKVAEFERKVADYEGVDNAVATSSCTTALHLVLEAMGLKSGHDVIVPAFTFVATANAVEYTGANAVFADICPKTFNITVDDIDRVVSTKYSIDNGLYVNKKTGNKLWGLIIVNEFGLCANVPDINVYAKKHNLKVIEDSACALGASIKGTHEGAFGNPSCLSFHPRKSITTGEGGMVLCDDDDLAEKIRQLRSHGAAISELQRHHSKGYMLPDYNELGFNYRMTDIQAAIGCVQIDRFDEILNARIMLAARYNEKLSRDGCFLDLPFAPQDYLHTYQSYVCMINQNKIGISDLNEAHTWRNEFMEYLESEGISTRQGTHAVHTLGYYREKYSYKPSDLPNSYMCDRLSIALPLYVEMTHTEQDYVISKIEAYAKNCRG